MTTDEKDHIPDVGQMAPASDDSADWLRHAYADQAIRAQKAEAEIERLRSYTYGYTSGISPGFEIKLTLTDEEREAIHHVVGDMADITGPVEDTLRGLLDRTKRTAPPGSSSPPTARPLSGDGGSKERN